MAEATPDDFTLKYGAISHDDNQIKDFNFQKIRAFTS